jgi:hypothetical protein
VGSSLIFDHELPKKGKLAGAVTSGFISGGIVAGCASGDPTFIGAVTIGAAAGGIGAVAGSVLEQKLDYGKVNPGKVVADGAAGVGGGLLGAGLGKALGGMLGTGTIRWPNGLSYDIDLNGMIALVMSYTDIEQKALTMAGLMAAGTSLQIQLANGLAMAVQRGSNDSDPATKMAAEEASANGQPPTTSPSRQRNSKRRQYMGQNPNKSSSTYKDVIERMRAEGKLIGEGTDAMVKASDGTWIPIMQAELCHQYDAMLWWNNFGKFCGPKHPKVREFMLDGKNYILDKPGLNRSAGAKLKGIGYDPPEINSGTLVD